MTTCRCFVAAAFGACLLLAACGANADLPASSSPTLADPNAATLTGNANVVATGDSKVIGSIEGHSLTVKSASFVQLNTSGNHSVAIVLSDDPAYCASITKRQKKENQTKLIVLAYVAAADGTSTPVVAGSYKIVGDSDKPTAAGNYGIAAFDVQGVDCTPLLKDPNEGFATEGTLTIKSIGDDTLEGTVTLVVEGNTLSGTLHATACPGLANPEAAPLTCTQG